MTHNLCFGLFCLASSVTVTASQLRLTPRAPSGAPIVSLENGSYYGVHNSVHNQDFFLGIPFAQPPLQDLRFHNPVSLNNTWSNALPATNYAYVSTAFGGCTAMVAENKSRNALAMVAIRSVINRARTVSI